jgi:DNA-directed RNA polymerase sigma subunit (sigma70/sigma32)|tara:strand:- start:129 stop:449 length:321 start_codon:yes stop_codon:yes gene_type:complete
MAVKGTQAETIVRAQKFARIIANGGRRSDCVRFAAENWGVQERAVDKYLQIAREQLKADWDLERPQMVADLLSQCSTLQMEARRAGQYHIALGAINTAAKLASLCS